MLVFSVVLVIVYNFYVVGALSVYAKREGIAIP